MALEEYMTELDLSDKVTPITNESDVDSAVEDGVVDGVEVEVVDDTPEADRGRTPLPDDIKQKLDAEIEAEEYSGKVRQRIDTLKKSWHDERRDKEAAMRERDEAVRFAQKAYSDRAQYQQQLHSGEAWAIDQAKQRAALQLDSAKRAYREAYESGDSERMIEAHQALSAATADVAQFNNYTPRYALQEQQYSVQPQQAPEEPYVPPEPDSRTAEWGERNTWFGKDQEMTSLALGIHQRLVAEGFGPGTEAYFERVDARMREVFPDKFGIKKRQSATVVAPVGRSPKGKKVVLTQTQVALARRLGISPEAYARELVKQQEN
jgi:hypothetical protein